MPVFYSQSVLNLRLRFDEAMFLTGALKTAEPRTRPPSARAPTGASAQPLPFLNEPIDRASQVLNVRPLSYNCSINGVRQAGTVKGSILFQDLPIRATFLRAVGFEFHLGTIPADEWSRSVSAGKPAILRTREPDGRPNPDTVRLVGVIDLWRTERTESGHVVEFEGRDLRGLLLDAKASKEQFEGLDLRRPIEDVVSQILKSHPDHLFDSFQVQLAVSEWEDVSERDRSPFTEDGLTRVRRNHDGRGHSGPMPGKADDLNYWDLITNYCQLVGAIPTFVGEVLLLHRAVSVFEQLDRGFDPSTSPFLFERRVKGKQLRVRRMVYGANLEKLTWERKFQGFKSQAIEVVSIDTTGHGQLVKARFPPETADERHRNAQRTGVSPSGRRAEGEVRRIAVPGIRDRSLLQRIAENTYRELAAGEMGGSFTTYDLASLAGDNADPDLLRVRPGDACEILEAPEALRAIDGGVDEAGRQAAMSEDAATQSLVAKGFDPRVARAIIASQRGHNFGTFSFFRLSNTTYNGDASGSCQVSADFQNYIAVRSEVDAETLRGILPPARTAARRAA